MYYVLCMFKGESDDDSRMDGIPWLLAYEFPLLQIPSLLCGLQQEGNQGETLYTHPGAEMVPLWIQGFKG